MEYIIGLGSNTGDRVSFLNAAISGLDKVGQVLKRSSLYKSAAYGFENQPDFINAVCVLKCSLNSFRLLRKIKQIEPQIGRTKSFHWGPREIDIDIIEWNGPEINSEILRIPHSDLGNRAFVLKPLQEILPDFNSRSGQSVTDMLDKLNDKNTVSLSNEQW